MYDQRRVEELIAKFRAGVRDAEIRKVRNEVFDARTLANIYKLMENGVIKLLERVIATGKEANVFLARDPANQPVAVKIYRIETTEFRHMWKYLDGDPRFLHVRRNRRGIIKAWVRREFKNLETAFKAGVSVPYPIALRENILVMEFIGEGCSPAPLLKDYLPEDKEGFAETLLDNLSRLYFKANLIHADMSEYNILVHEDKPVLIDFGQTVPWDHPLAGDFFRRDLERISKVLSLLGREMAPGEVLRELEKRAKG